MIRKWLFLLVIFTAVGILAELVLIGHYENVYQSLPLAACALFVLAIFLVKSQLLRKLMIWVLVITGLAGIGFHLNSNWEFEKEMYPNLSGMKMIVETFTGALPVLAPGSLISLALMGFIIYKFEKSNNADH